MNSILYIIRRSVLLLVCCLALGVSAKGRKLVILHTNDTHSQIYPFNQNLKDTLKAGRAGAVRRVNLIKEERRANPKNLLLLDSGDFSQGSPYYTMFKGDVEIGLMNLMGYDAATIGNHEFDFGLDNMARLFRMAKFPIVCANYDFTGTVCEDVVKPYTIIRRDGVKVGIFGLSPKMEGLVTGANCVGVRFLDPITAAQQMVDVLRNREKCDVVVCLSHLGYETGDDFSDEILAAKISGIDIILGGHTHTYLEKPVEVKNAKGVGVPVNQNGKSGIFISKFVVELSK